MQDSGAKDPAFGAQSGFFKIWMDSLLLSLYH